ncbi:MAG: SUMF1/EgtB/PvdO family nonheme iron enzyme [Hyphomicrobiales bacterium]|nr:SUMF1/EgtB/PvdO family nonheme iron enzyme [Hyphomicrobiales bacterium]MBV9428827.1 SUMF1/EgtB/PvdO family nonheme iron enzyme [Bradyrhizobiaceae bacterium]
MPAIFISHSSRDNAIADEIKAWLAADPLGFERVFLDFDKDTGIGAGDDWEKRLYMELSRCHAVILVLTPNWFSSKWCFAELTQARALGKLVLPVVCAPLGEQDILPQIQKVDLVDGNPKGLELIQRRLHAVADELARGFQLSAHRPPYPGIQAFELEDAAIYFGRDDETRAIIEKLDARRTQGGARFLLIIGASGAGKSSLLKAGVLPQLSRRRRHWIVLPPIRPERAPLSALAKSVAHHTGSPSAADDWYRRLKDPRAFSEIVTLTDKLRVGVASAATVLLPIDQFEELFTIAEPVERAAFLALVATSLDPKHQQPLMVVATGRSDVLHGLLEGSALAVLTETTSLPSMPLDRVPRLVEGPAEVAGLLVEQGLGERIKRDVDSPEALPLLAYTLALLHETTKSGKYLTLTSYLALGDAARGLNPVQNSVRLAADQAITGLRPKPDEHELTALRDAFLPNLVHLRLDDNKLVRRPARRVELPREADRLLEVLLQARLLSARSADEEGSDRLGEAVVEVAHEALFEAWPTLKGWLDEEYDFLVDFARLRSAHEIWKDAEKPDKRQALLQGLLLTRARRWLRKHPRRFASANTESLRTFIQLSHRVVQRRKLRAQAPVAAIVAALILFGAWLEAPWLKERSYWLQNVHPLSVGQERLLKSKSDFIECTDCPTMVVIPAGSITMGSLDSANERPPHTVTINRPFAVSMYELTFTQWDACVRYGDCAAGVKDLGWGRGSQPVINVSWIDAKQYVGWLKRITGKNYRLLTEAEWEYAARADSLAHFSFGNDDAQLDQYAWYALNAERRPHPVGLKKPNAFGLYDMHGNVSEWIEDCYHNTYQDASSDGEAWTAANCNPRIIRGGSWFHRARMLRSAARDWSNSDKGNESIGIRIARSLTF